MDRNIKLENRINEIHKSDSLYTSSQNKYKEAT